MDRPEHELRAAAAVAALAGGGLRAEAAQTAQLLQACGGTLGRFIRIRLMRARLPENLVADCGQNVLTRVWYFRKSYRGSSEGEFWRWIRRICDNERRRTLAQEARADQLRAAARAAACPETAKPADEVNAVVLDEKLTALRDCVDGLSERLRRVIELTYYYPCLPERAVAEVLKCSPANVHKLKREALRLLVLCLSRKGIP